VVLVFRSFGFGPLSFRRRDVKGRSCEEVAFFFFCLLGELILEEFSEDPIFEPLPLFYPVEVFLLAIRSLLGSHTTCWLSSFLVFPNPSFFLFFFFSIPS